MIKLQQSTVNTKRRAGGPGGLEGRVAKWKTWIIRGVASCIEVRAGRLQSRLAPGLHIKGSGGLHIKLGCGKGRSGGLLFSAACPVLFRSPPHRLFVQPIGPPFWLVFCAARQPADSSRFSFGNMALQPARPAGPPISVIRNPLTKLYALLWMRLQSKFHLCVYTVWHCKSKFPISELFNHFNYFYIMFFLNNMHQNWQFFSRKKRHFLNLLFLLLKLIFSRPNFMQYSHSVILGLA